MYGHATVELPDMVNILLIPMLQDGGHGSYSKVPMAMLGCIKLGL